MNINQLRRLARNPSYQLTQAQLDQLAADDKPKHKKRVRHNNDISMHPVAPPLAPPVEQPQAEQPEE